MSVLDDLEEMAGGIGAAGTALDGLSQSFGRFDNALSSSSNALQRTTPAVLNTGSAAKGTGAAFDVLKGKASSLVEGLVPTSGALGVVSQALKALGPEGEAAAVVLGIVVSVITAATDTLWAWATAAVAAAQRVDALRDAFDALAGGAGAGDRILAQTSKLAADLPFITSQVNAWAKSMAMVGKTGDALDLSVKAIAASAAITRTAGEAAQSLIKRWALMAETGQKVKLDRRQLSALAESGADLNELARLLGVAKDKLGGMSIDAEKLGNAFQQALVNKGGPALDDLGLTWDSIKAKFNEGLGSIFTGMSDAVKPLMREIKSFFAEFNKGSKTIAPVKSLMTSFLTTIFGWATKAAHAIHVGFLAAQIALLSVYIAAAPLVRLLRAIYTNALVLQGLKAGLLLLAAPFIILGVILVGVAVGIVTVVTVLGTLASIIVGAVSGALGWLISLPARAAAALSGMGSAASDAAHNFVNGLVSGIKAGVGAVAEAVKGLASGAVAAFTGALGIKSPSRVMKAHGRQLPAGAAEGIDDGADEAQRSMEEMLDPPKAKPRSAAKSAGKTAPGINFNNCVFFPGADEGKIRQLLLKVWQQEMAAGPEPAPT